MKSVTASEAYSRDTSHVTVTDLLNNELLIAVPDGFIFCPRWIDVRVWRDDAGETLAEPISFRATEPWHVNFKRCAYCGQDYVTRLTTQTRVDRWRACERTLRTAQQRARRRRRQARRQTECLHCGASISAVRSSRRYCSGKCRIAVMRARHGQLVLDNLGHVHGTVRTDNTPLRVLSCPVVLSLSVGAERVTPKGKVSNDMRRSVTA